MKDQELDDLIGCFYDGILSSQGWSQALQRLALVTGSRAASLVMWNRPEDRALVGEQFGLPQQLLEDYGKTFQAMDPAREFVEKIEVGGWYMDERHLGTVRIRRLPFYQEFLRSYDLDSTMTSPFLRSETDLDGFLCLSARPGERDMDRIARRLRPVMPHIQRAGRLRLKLIELTQQSSVSLQVLNRFRYPLMVMKLGARVTLANEAAQRWLNSSECLLSMHSTHMTRVKELVADACGCGAEKSARAGGQRFNKADGTVYSLVAIPLPAASTNTWALSEPSALVIVNDPEWETQPEARLLNQMFQLTPAEIRLLNRLQDGLALREASDQLNISIETARSQLKSIFAKIGVNRQVDLQRLLSHLRVFV